MVESKQVDETESNNTNRVLRRAAIDWTTGFPLLKTGASVVLCCVLVHSSEVRLR